MPDCNYCDSHFDNDPWVKYCSVSCQSKASTKRRTKVPKKLSTLESPSNPTPVPEPVDINQVASRLVQLGYLPAPYNIDPIDTRPLWDFAGLAALFGMPSEKLVKILRINGPEFLE